MNYILTRNHLQSFECRQCRPHFGDIQMLEGHIRFFHSSVENHASNSHFDCNICGVIIDYFPTFVDHLQCLHFLCVYPCYKCLTFYHHPLELDSHIVSVHHYSSGPRVPQPIGRVLNGTTKQPEIDQLDSYNNIQQFDGPNDLTLLSDTTEGLNRSVQLRDTNMGHISDFTLNQQKQTKRIIDDTMLNDYEVNVNNNNENCTIKCSSGFYFQVSKPCFATLNVNSVLNFKDVGITVTEVLPFLDRNKCEFGRRPRFAFLTHNDNLGGVVVHLQHSNRNIQIQGGSNMISTDKSAVWFAKFLLSRFEEQATLKKYKIKNTNEMF